MIAAKTLAEKGFNTLCLDRKQEIGPPKRCAEGLGGGWFQRCGIKPEKEWAVQDIYGAVLYSPNGKRLELRSNKVAGYVLERKIFEKDLARYASFAGARIQCKSFVQSAKRENGKVILEVNEFDEIKQYRAPLIIGADGVDSRVGRFLGMKTHNKLIDIDSGFQYEMSNIDGYEEDLLHLWFGVDVAPRGYVWIFPKRARTGNVGIGIGAYVEKTARYYLDKWIAQHPNISKGSIIEVNGSSIPVGGFMDNMVADNLMLVGDAAHQVDPIHGGGIGIAMEAAMLAANVAAEVRDQGKNFSQANLSPYNPRWYAARGNQLKKRLKGRHLLEKLSDKDFDILAEALTAEECLKIADGEFDSKEKFFTLTKKLVQHPGLVGVMTKYLSPATPEDAVTGNAPGKA